MNRPLSLLVSLLALTLTLGAAPGEIGFVEDFALAPDRTVPLQELIPGTTEYYYYHCLRYQNTGQLDQAAEMIRRWTDKEKHGQSAQLVEMENRQALLQYVANPKAALERITQQLGLTFSHSRRERERETNYPTALDPRLLDRDALDKQAFGRNRLLDGFTPAAYRRLAGMELPPERRRALLDRLELPDLPNLVDLVVADLRLKDSGGFGSLRVHSNLTLAQLAACAERLPNLWGDRKFVDAYLQRLVPKKDEDVDVPAVRLAYLERLQALADRLPPLWNVLKASILYRRLEFDRSQDVYDKERFLAYLKLPRSAPYVRREYLGQPTFQGQIVNLGESAGEYAVIGVRIGNDEPLVRAFLQHFLVDARGYAEFAPYVEEGYLKEVYAEANILAGVGDQEAWQAMIAPEKLRALKERVDIELLPTCKGRFAIDEPVQLAVAVKNVPSLIVRVYEINTFNYYRTKGTEIGTSVDLDGLVANREQTFAYEQPALRRHAESFSFPDLNRPGVWVIELIGNGRSSRAVIRKGSLRYTERRGAAGHVFRVYDQDNALVTDASLWLGSQEFRPEESGEIAVPYAASAKAAPETFVLRRGEFAALGRFQHLTEHYVLDAAFLLDREGLIQNETARLLIRPRLLVNAIPCDVALLEKVELTITSVDIHRINTSRTYSDLKLANDRETVCEFRVPPDLVHLSYRLSGKVRIISQGKDEELGADGGCSVNGIDREGRIASLHLRPTAEGYILELLGKTGEPLPGRVVSLELHSSEYSFPLSAIVQTDGSGHVQLGKLPGIASILCRAADTVASFATAASDAGAVALPGTLAGVVGDTFQLPLPGGTVEQVSLVELGLDTVAGSTILANQGEHVVVADGAVTIRGLGAGNYLLAVRNAWGQELGRTEITVVQGARQNGWALGPQWFAESRNPRLLGIASAELAPAGEGKDRLAVQLANATPTTRVHVLVGRYVLPDPPVFPSPDWPDPQFLYFAAADCYYVSGRDLGDEFRYVLERRTASRRPGNLLTKPSLLLNPWSLGETQSRGEELRRGNAYAETATPAAPPMGSRGPANGMDRGMGGEGGGGDHSASYDFLATPALVVPNLVPDADGKVAIDLDLAGRQYVQIIAMNGQDVVRQPLLLSFVAEPTRDLRMRREMPADRHVTEQKRVDIVAAGQTFAVPDLPSSKVRAYATLADAYGLLKTLSGDGTLGEFEFVCRWSQLADEEKRTLYGKYACHELSFFLYQKDRPFFDQVVKPYLVNKKDKTFLDHWLLGDDLAAYLEPWPYGRLNIVERILLAQRLPNEAAAIRRQVQDLYDLLSPDIEGFNHRFDTAVKSAGLEEGKGMEVTETPMLFSPLASGDMGAMGAVAAAPAAAMPAVLARRAVPVEAEALEKAKQEKGARKKAAEMDVLQPQWEAVADGAVAIQGRNFYSDVSGRADAKLRERQRQLFRAVETTQEWVENNYYHIRIGQQTADLVQVNGFWLDYANRAENAPFLSTHLDEACHSFAEMLLALAVLDLPFAADAAEPVYDGASMTLVPKHSLIVYHQQIRESGTTGESPLLLGQNFFAADDRYRHENNRQYDKFVTEEFQSDRIYGCQVVVTNPTSTPRELDVLLSIPLGAMPVANGFRTRGIHLALDGYATRTVDYYFYFPKPGDYPIYPAHAAQDGALLAFAQPFRFHVVETLTKIDTSAWDYVSQYGSDDEVIDFLKANNVDRLDLDLIAFRMKDAQFLARAIPLLRGRHVFSATLWSYGVLHNDAQAIREYLPHTALAARCGVVFHSPLLDVEPVPRATYEHKEYWPLVNARAHEVGGRPRILNRQFLTQYTAFLTTLAYRPKLDGEANLALVVYLLLQDRVDAALTAFAQIDPAQVAERVPYDYLKAYLAFCQSDPKSARRIAREYRDYPVPRWRDLFGEVLAQCDQIEGDAAAAVDPDNRDQTQTALAATQPGFDFAVEDGEIRLDYQNLKSVEVNFYRMDLELLFSRTPFLMDVSDQFSIVRPNATETVDLAAGKTARTIAIPKEFASVNTMVEIVAGGLRKAKPHYPHDLTVQVIEAYGQLQVVQTKTRKPLPAVYVKIYARQPDGKVAFFKDGYTDLRGRFDYASTSTGDVQEVERFAILVLSDEAGAVVREAPPPTR